MQDEYEYKWKAAVRGGIDFIYWSACCIQLPDALACIEIFECIGAAGWAVAALL